MSFCSFFSGVLKRHMGHLTFLLDEQVVLQEPYYKLPVMNMSAPLQDHHLNGMGYPLSSRITSSKLAFGFELPGLPPEPGVRCC